MTAPVQDRVSAGASSADASHPGARPTPLVRLGLDDPRWLRFVASRSDATPFHHPAWASLLSEAYRFPAFALALADADTIHAGAPFLEVRDLARRRTWIALPFTDECPLLATDRAVEDRFLSALIRTEGGPPRIKLRTTTAAPGWHTNDAAVIHELALESDPLAVRAHFSKSQVVRGIKRADRDGIVVREARSAADRDAFFALHVGTRRRQGVPVQPRLFFDLLWDRFVERGTGSILLAEANGRPVAGALFLSWNATTIYKFGASDPDYWRMRPNHALFWTAIRAACARGDRRLDFGRSDLDNTGLRAFKSSWGAVERPLVYSSSTASGGAGNHRHRAESALAFTIRHAPAWVCRGAGRTLYRYSAAG